VRLVYRHTLAMRGSDQSEDHLIGIAFHGGGRNESGEPPRTQPYLLAAVSSCGTGAADTAGREARASNFTYLLVFIYSKQSCANAGTSAQTPWRPTNTRNTPVHDRVPTTVTSGGYAVEVC